MWVHPYPFPSLLKQKLFCCDFASHWNFSYTYESSLTAVLQYFESCGWENLHSDLQSSWTMGTAHCLFIYLYMVWIGFYFFAVELGLADIGFTLTVSIASRWYFSAVVLKITSPSQDIYCFCTKMCRKLTKFSLSASMQLAQDLINQLFWSFWS